MTWNKPVSDEAGLRGWRTLIPAQCMVWNQAGEHGNLWTFKCIHYGSVWFKENIFDGNIRPVWTVCSQTCRIFVLFSTRRCCHTTSDSLKTFTQRDVMAVSCRSMQPIRDSAWLITAPWLATDEWGWGWQGEGEAEVPAGRWRMMNYLLNLAELAECLLTICFTRFFSFSEWVCLSDGSCLCVCASGCLCHFDCVLNMLKHTFKTCWWWMRTIMTSVRKTSLGTHFLLSKLCCLTVGFILLAYCQVYW